MPSGPTRDAADRRRWQRLLLISDAVKGVDVLRRCALPDVGVVTYDHERASAEDIARACANKVADADGVKKVDSIALVAPCGDGSVAIARDVVLTVESLLDADIAAFVRGVVALLEPGANFNGGAAGWISRSWTRRRTRAARSPRRLRRRSASRRCTPPTTSRAARPTP